LPGFRNFADALVVGGEVDDRGQNGANQHEGELRPIEKWDAKPKGLGLVVEGRPQDDDILDDKEQVPQTPNTRLLLRFIHSHKLPDTLSGDAPRNVDLVIDLAQFRFSANLQSMLQRQKIARSGGEKGNIVSIPRPSNTQKRVALVARLGPYLFYVGA
jgi:hypothetical protein